MQAHHETLDIFDVYIRGFINNVSYLKGNNYLQGCIQDFFMGGDTH